MDERLRFVAGCWMARRWQFGAESSPRRAIALRCSEDARNIGRGVASRSIAFRACYTTRLLLE